MRRPRTEAGAHSFIPSAPNKGVVAVNQRPHHSGQLLLTGFVNEMNYCDEEEHKSQSPAFSLLQPLTT